MGEKLTVIETAEALGVSYYMLKQLRRRGEFTAPLAHGQRVRYWDKDDVEAWKAENEHVIWRIQARMLKYSRKSKRSKADA